jgi:hypothetical protein
MFCEYYDPQSNDTLSHTAIAMETFGVLVSFVLINQEMSAPHTIHSNWSDYGRTHVLELSGRLLIDCYCISQLLRKADMKLSRPPKRSTAAALSDVCNCGKTGASSSGCTGRTNAPAADTSTTRSGHHYCRRPRQRLAAVVLRNTKGANRFNSLRMTTINAGSAPETA